MSWVRFDDNYRDHEKVVYAGKSGRELHMAMIFYCARNLTDGFIHEGMVAKLAVSEEIENWPDALQRLMTILPRYKNPLVYRRENGFYELHDYHKYQPSKAQIEAQRSELSEKRAQAGREGGRQSGVTRRSKNEANGEANWKQKRSPDPVPVSVSEFPLPNTVSETATGARARQNGNGSDHPWAAYDPDAAAVFDELVSLDVGAGVAGDLLKCATPQQIRNQIAWLKYRTLDNAVAGLVTAIKQNWSEPAELLAEREKAEAGKRDREVRERSRTEAKVARDAKSEQTRHCDALLDSLEPDAYEKLRIEALNSFTETLRRSVQHRHKSPTVRSKMLGILRERCAAGVARAP